MTKHLLSDEDGGTDMNSAAMAWLPASKTYAESLSTDSLQKLQRQYLDLIREADTPRDRETFHAFLDIIENQLNTRTEDNNAR